MGGLVARLEPDALTPTAAVRLLAELGRLGKFVTTGEALVAPRVEASKAYVTAGYRSTGQLLASAARTNEGHAARVVETGQQVADHEQTAAALRA